MDIASFSGRYTVRKLKAEDAGAVYELCRRNQLFYQYCPPFVTEENIIEDMKALPPNKKLTDKYYVGYFNGEKLIAVMDFIRAFPNPETDFIGFFMTDVSVQKKGIGSAIIEELCIYRKSTGVLNIRLGWVKGNPQSEHFWHKNGFCETGVSYHTERYTVIVAQKTL